MTGRDLIASSLRLIRVIATEESLAASEASDGLSALNQMLGSWSNEGLLIYQIVQEKFSLTAGKQSFSMGPGGDFNTIRPILIEKAFLRDEVQSPALELPVDILTLGEWSEIKQKSTQSTLPRCVYFDPSYPLAVVNLYPSPTIANKLVIWSQKPLTEISTLDTVISFPPGYERALKFNLALDLSPEYGKQVSQIVADIANESKAALKRTNHRPALLKCDDALVTTSGYNILTGGSM